MIEGKCLNLEMLEGLGSSAVETLNPKPTPKPQTGLKAALAAKKH